MTSKWLENVINFVKRSTVDRIHDKNTRLRSYKVKLVNRLDKLNAVYQLVVLFLDAKPGCT